MAFDESLLVQVANQLAGRSLRKHVYLFLIFTFVILVHTSTTIFRVFQCQTFPLSDGGEERWLRADYSISCLDQRWKDARAFAILMIFVYPIGIPAIYAVLLWKKRDTLGDEAAMEKEREEGYPTVGYLTFLFQSYVASSYYFEVIECARRLLLASVLGIVSDNASAAPVLGSLITIAFSFVFAFIQPLKPEDTMLGIVLAYSLILIFLGALMIKVDVTSEDEHDQEVFGAILVVIFFAGPATPIIKVAWSCCTQMLRTATTHNSEEEDLEELVSNVDLPSESLDDDAQDAAEDVDTPLRGGASPGIQDNLGTML